MKRKPVIGYVAPDYPSRDDGAREAPLRMPARWKRSAHVAGAAALFFFPVSCDAADAPVADITAPATGERKGAAAARPAPKLFTQAEGRGSFGCVAVAPPAFLTEADARQIVMEEFRKAGVQLTSTTQLAPTIRKLKVSHPYDLDAEGQYRQKTKIEDQGPVTLDGFDPDHHIGFELVSEATYLSLGEEPSHTDAPPEYDLQGLAKKVEAEAAQDPSLHVGVFYAPLALDWRDAQTDTATRIAASKAKLRAQIDEFLHWLKEHGIL